MINRFFKKDASRRHRKFAALGLVLAASLVLASCGGAAKESEKKTDTSEMKTEAPKEESKKTEAPKESEKKAEKKKLVATSTMLNDLCKVIAGDNYEVVGLMGPGVDPHLYEATPGDVKALSDADVVAYHGLHFEGKMGEIFENLTKQGKDIIVLEDGLNKDDLLPWEAEEGEEVPEGGLHDPHFWWNVEMWGDAAKEVAKGLSKADPEHKADYEANLQNYLKELKDLDAYVVKRAEEVPEESRILVTAHDAFNYFGKKYGFKVEGLQGVSTETEAGTADVSELADFIVKHKLKAIFVETSVPEKTIKSLQEAVKAKGFNVEIGGSLYSDSLGDDQDENNTFVKTVKANIDTIVDALK